MPSEQLLARSRSRGPRFSSRTEATHSTRFDRWVLANVQRSVPGAPIRFVLWDGFAIGPTDAVATVILKNRRALLGWLWDPELNFGETYMCGAMEVRGDLSGLLDAIYRAMPESARRTGWQSETHDERASRDNVHAHYDLGNDFYRLWLDEQLLYTCAYFPTVETTLEDAQVAKMDRVCRKLWLRPGERVVDAGCGWGAMSIHMARHYGVSVLACNVSGEQIAEGRARAKREGVANRVDFVLEDYRNLTGRYDAFVSIGMLEHVGLENYDGLGELIGRALTPEGRGLLHFIGRDRRESLNAWIRRRIFPGAYPPTLHEVCEHVFEPARLAVLDLENLRLHYELTLRHWLDRFERASDHVAAMFDESFVRAWRLYLAGSHAAFETGSLELFQIVFTRRGNNAIPWTRPS